MLNGGVKVKNMKKDLINKVIDLADSVKYQKGSIVSQTYMDKKVGTVTLFSFDKGQGLSEHTAPFDAMVYIVDGKVEIKIAGKKKILVKGQTIIMPANKPHALSAVNKFKMLLIMIKS
jgi:quercetin dioxygenase-like cupin family protein